MRQTVVRFACALGFLGFSLPVAAAPEEYHLDASLGTDFPVSVGARVGAELPSGFRLSSSLGFLPGPYAEVLNGTLVGAGAYSEDTGTLILAALDSSLIWRTHLGFRPSSTRGLYVDVGYGLLTLGGGATTAELVAGLTRYTLPDSASRESQSYRVESTLHMLDVEVGWEWVLMDRLKLRCALGGAFTVAASTTMTPEFQPLYPAAAASFEAAGEDYLNDTYTSYVFTPVATLSAGYAFF